MLFYFQGELNSSPSVDPDSDDTDQMSFVWYCKDVSDADFSLGNLTHEPVVSENNIAETPSTNSVSNMVVNRDMS